VPRRVPPGARLHPALALFVSEEPGAIAQAAPLRALFALLDREGAAEVHRRTRARTSWHVVERERSEVALRLEISEPADARGVVELVMDSAEYQRAWQLIREGQWVGITSGRRLRSSADGSQPALEDVFAACIPLDADLPPALAVMAHSAA
jgi:hypothetical protein